MDMHFHIKRLKILTKRSLLQITDKETAFYLSGYSAHPAGRKDSRAAVLNHTDQQQP